jgi:hypothetical protein
MRKGSCDEFSIFQHSCNVPEENNKKLFRISILPVEV